jgi:hypothetical protein
MSALSTRPAEAGTGAVLERGLDTSSGLDFAMFHHAHTPPPRPSTTSELPIPAPLSGALVGDAPAATGGRAPGGGSASVPGGAGVADRATGKAKGVGYSQIQRKAAPIRN